MAMMFEPSYGGETPRWMNESQQHSYLGSEDGQSSDSLDWTTDKSQRSPLSRISYQPVSSRRGERIWRSARGHHSDIHLSCDPAAHTEDRKSSLFSATFRPAPTSYQPVPPRRAPQSPYSPVAHPRPRPPDQQIALLSPRWLPHDPTSTGTYRERCLTSRERVDTGLATHFEFGTDAARLDTEHKKQFRPAPPKAHAERVTRQLVMQSLPYFEAIKQSENTRDMESDPFRANTNAVLTMRSAPQRRQHLGGSVLAPLPVHGASLTANDFQPITARRITPSQQTAAQRFQTIFTPTTQASHIFHQDTKDEFITTARNDYVRPATVIGQSLLAGL